MVARARSSHLAFTLPLGAAALLVAALAAPSCDGGSSTTGGSGNAGSAGSSSGPCPTACEGDTPVCDPDTKTCVGCLPGDMTCAAGQYCDPTSKTCESGCSGDSDCTSPLVCDTSTHQCVGCTEDAQCNPGTICSSGACIPGCNDNQPCTMGQVCCTGTCTDLSSDVKSCGACGSACPDIPGAAEVCTMGMCGMGACDMGYADCNLSADDGCEWDTAVFGMCSCMPGATQECYSGPMGTKGVGTCKAGVSTCDPSGATWGPCMGEVTPMFDTCADGQDNDCDGTPDNAKDLDGDGWTPCDGDCCDVVMVGVCGDPALVNPGAFEVAGNMVDDDCDGMIDNPLAACDANLASNSNTAGDYAKAIDLCQTTTANAALKDKKWGVISSKLSLADGNGSPANVSKSIRQGFGTNITPLMGSRIAVLSTGAAAAKNAPNNTNPAYAAFQDDLVGGQNENTSSAQPADWLSLNGGTPPNAPGCPPPSDTTANDPVMLTVQVRAPTNAKSFAVSSFFFSSEYPEWVCSPWNDFFVTLLDSQFVPGAGQSPNPMDKNLAFYQKGNSKYPVGVNLAYGNTGLFSQCENGTTGCMGAPVIQGSTNVCTGTNLLAGTGFDTQVAGASIYKCGNNDLIGGGTGWLTTNGNVKPGETITLRFAIWDMSDHIFDSVVLLDNFQWSVDASTPGTHQ